MTQDNMRTKNIHFSIKLSCLGEELEKKISLYIIILDKRGVFRKCRDDGNSIDILVIYHRSLIRD